MLFIQIWKVLVPLKKKYIWTSNRNKVIEVAVLAFVVSSLAILLPLAFGCEPYSKIHPEDVKQHIQSIYLEFFYRVLKAVMNLQMKPLPFKYLIVKKANTIKWPLCGLHHLNLH